jgi:hypothetical protein
VSYAYNPKKGRWWYDHIIDWLLSHPGGSLKQCALELERSPQYIRMICASDLFQRRLAERRASLNERLEIAVVMKAKQTSGKALDLLLERMEEQPEKMSTSVVVNIMEKSLSALYGPKTLVGAPVPAVTVQTNVMVSREVLADARAKIREAEMKVISERSELAEEVQPPPEPGEREEESILDDILGPKASNSDPPKGGHAA